MSEPLRYHADSRALQEQFDSTRQFDFSCLLRGSGPQTSENVPRPDAPPPIPSWKMRPIWHEVLLANDPARRLEPGAQGV